MKIHLLPEKGTFFKANLHCHTTISDGEMSPQEIKQRYMSEGYSVIAFTDHEYMIDHSDLSDAGFLALKGYEISVNQPSRGTWSTAKTTHLNLIARTPDVRRQLFPAPENAWFEAPPESRNVECISAERPQGYDAASIQSIIDEANKNGFLVAYNHPVWSLAVHEDYAGLRGLWAMEIYNGGADIEGTSDFAAVYDHFLRECRSIKCLATDDNHSARPSWSPQRHCGLGWVCIKAEALDYRNIIAALENGDFYSSTGPEIYSLTAENGAVKIKCSPARRIILNTAGRAASTAYGQTNGDTITEAVLRIPDEKAGYLRVTVEDACGKSAYTNAYDIESVCRTKQP